MPKNKAAHLLQDLQQRQLLRKHPPSWMVDSVQYLTMMGSVAYGVADVGSDIDIYGFCIPPKRIVFPHIQGWVPGFENQPEVFDQWQEHHIQDVNAAGGSGREYDFSVYNIVKYFTLVMDNNPNMVDSLFTPERCVLWQTPLAVHVRENRHIFLSKKAWYTFKGYAWQQRTKMRNRSREVLVNFLGGFGIDYRDFNGELTAAHVKDYLDGKRVEAFEVIGNPLSGVNKQSLSKLNELLFDAERNLPDGERAPAIERWGFDLKFAYHLVRLVFEVEQILEEGDLDITRSRETLKAIRAGEWTEKQISEFFENKLSGLEKLYDNSTLRNRPDKDAVKRLLLECLEMHYGSLENCVVKENEAVRALQEIQDILDRNRIIFE